ncbi:hypothetical protein JCM10207_005393 [Rhodosporidiobolus poonsookiae]
MLDAQTDKVEVDLLPIEDDDLIEVADGNLAAFPTFYGPLEPESIRPNHDIRVRRQANRLRKVLASPHVLGTKAVLASGEDKGKLVGITLWHRPGAPIFNLKRRFGEESDEDSENWVGVDPEAWNGKWGGWDEVRKGIMGEQPHWYLAPIWVIPQYHGKGIGRKLITQVLDMADQQSPSVPIYLEASADGKKMYEKLGFVVEGGGEYVEMVRWSPDGKRREEVQ